MALLSRWEELRKYLLRRGLDGASEEGRIVRAWLWEELRQSPPSLWEAGLPAATDQAIAIYRGFISDFGVHFLEETGAGETWVRRFLRQRLGFAPEPAVEVVLNRIRDRRRHLLHAFRRKYQASLFGPTTFRREGVRGYLRQVAWVESRKAPLAELRRVAGKDPEVLDNLLLPQATSVDEQDFGLRARQLAEFWSTANGFTRAHYLEGLVSLGLGWMTDEPLLAERCRAYLEQKLPAWNERWECLTERLGRLLDRCGEKETWLAQAWDWVERDRLRAQLDRVRGRLDSLRIRLRQHLDRLPPRPKETEVLLAGVVHQQLGSVRFHRIGREIAIFEQRVVEGGRALQAGFAGDFDPSVHALLADILAHNQEKPPSPGEHGLTEPKRARRRRMHERWLRVGDDLCGRARLSMDTLFRTPATRVPPAYTAALMAWLGDVEDFYELGILDRLGVIGGLKTRQGWRLDRLLRPAGGIGCDRLPYRPPICERLC
jgi:hypothetical protein